MSVYFRELTLIEMKKNRIRIGRCDSERTVRRRTLEILRDDAAARGKKETWQQSAHFWGPELKLLSLKCSQSPSGACTGQDGSAI